LRKVLLTPIAAFRNDLATSAAKPVTDIDFHRRVWSRRPDVRFRGGMPIGGRRVRLFWTERRTAPITFGQLCALTSNKMIQKALAFLRNESGTVPTKYITCFGPPPRRLGCQRGAFVVRPNGRGCHGGSNGQIDQEAIRCPVQDQGES
jgi:hypothetical protein